MGEYGVFSNSHSHVVIFVGTVGCQKERFMFARVQDVNLHSMSGWGDFKITIAPGAVASKRLNCPKGRQHHRVLGFSI